MTQAAYNEQELLVRSHQLPELKFQVVDHPLVRHHLRFMRDVKTNTADFSAAVAALTPLLIYAATANLREKTTEIATPLAPMAASEIAQKVALVPILRSGFGMLGPARAIFPSAPVLAVGLKRDENTAVASWYRELDALPHLNHGTDVAFLILDPMLATGGSAIEVGTSIKNHYPHAVISMIAMIAAPEGVRALNQVHPDIAITLAALDDHLNEKSYIVPGLGDAGDRQFGT